MGISSYDYRVYYRYDENNSPIGFDLIKDGTTSTYTYEKNIQGDIVGILNDSTRRRVVTYVYDAWGKVTSVTGTDAETVGKYNSLRYRGYYYDTETGMYYLQSRYYDPSYRRFINADEPTLISELAQSSTLGGNLFAYCSNNAVMGYDPSGEFVCATSLALTAGTNFWNPVGWVLGALLAVAIVVTCVGIGIKAGQAIAQLSKNKRTKVPEKLKDKGKVKTPTSHPGEFTKKKDGTYEHNKSKWRFGRSKDGHRGDHWHAAPKNAKTGDYQNVSPDGRIL